ncbi:hypothetical protein [Leptospira weilii]|nr:hypothetical protein [Leptospira weilii]
MNTTSLFYFLESFTPDLKYMRMPKQIESDWMEQSNIIGNDRK